MAKLYFTNKAIDDLEAIWAYTVKTWSENQIETNISFLKALKDIFSSKHRLGF
jgi:hypothetical protein